MNNNYQRQQVFTDKYANEGWLILHGGEDISPGIYGMKNYKSHASDQASANDKAQMRQIEEAVRKGQKIIANCRTHQMIAAMSGLTLIQNMTHNGGHKILVRNLETGLFDEEVSVNNAHHQCVWTENKLEDENYKVYGYCNLSPYHDYQEGVKLDVKVEPEIMYFPKFKALTVQFHLDWMSRDEHSKVQQYVDKLINQLF
jgi:gamma-glutamyl-gamma-aminobutyrate hydrolase PuuD